MGLVACTAIIVKGSEALGFTSCLSCNGNAEARIEEERRSSDESKLRFSMVSWEFEWCEGRQGLLSKVY